MYYFVGEQYQEHDSPTDMVRASAFPTVEWLLRSSCSSTPSSSSVHSRTSRRTKFDSALVFGNLLSEWKCSNTSVAQNSWIRTPNGEELVDVVVRRRDRRIGIRFSNPYEKDYDRSDALVLVYGRFDMIFRISAVPEEESVRDCAYAILSMVPSWFTAQGRMIAGRRVSPEALVNVDRLASTGMLFLPSGSITRIRLSRASDWVHAFEQALSPPRLTSYADARLARPRN